MKADRLYAVPLTLKAARAWVDEHHRHHRAPQGGLFAIGAASSSGELVGCVIIGRPVSRMLDNGYTAEVTRLCTNGAHNACSMLYAAAWRACRALGYQRLITYTLASEPGTSLHAAGWREIGSSRGGTWSRPSRARFEESHPTEPKIVWEAPS